MAQVQVTRSLLRVSYNIETYPVEPLPLYSPPAARNADPETASIRSEAPSYHSEAPPYTPPANTITPPREPEQQYGLPNRRYAPGFQSRPHGSVADLQNHNYNISSWRPVRIGRNNRQYENVAKRRLQRDSRAAGGLLCSLTTAPPPTSTSPTASASSSSATSAATPPTTAPNEEPISPLEDPALVGEAAAARAKSQRLYRENCMRDPQEALKYESKGWDFMLGQMSDWEEREQSWNNFRRDLNCGRRLKLARRIGFRA